VVGDAEVGEVVGNAEVGEVVGDADVGEVVGNAEVGEVVGDADVGEVVGDVVLSRPDGTQPSKNRVVGATRIGPGVGANVDTYAELVVTPPPKTGWVNTLDGLLRSIVASVAGEVSAGK
jgi:alkylated DNA nucleotide flippase Atl1